LESLLNEENLSARLVRGDARPYPNEVSGAAVAMPRAPLTAEAPQKIDQHLVLLRPEL
jgi:hypothetical protein